jgi:hypothetical protein
VAYHGEKLVAAGMGLVMVYHGAQGPAEKPVLPAGQPEIETNPGSTRSALDAYSRAVSTAIASTGLIGGSTVALAMPAAGENGKTVFISWPSTGHHVPAQGRT